MIRGWEGEEVIRLGATEVSCRCSQSVSVFLFNLYEQIMSYQLLLKLPNVAIGKDRKPCTQAIPGSVTEAKPRM